MSQVISDLLGTLETVFRVARAAFNATGLTAPRTFTLPDVSGTVFTSGNLLNIGTTSATARTAIGVTPGVDVIGNNNAGVNALGMSWTSGNIRVTVDGVPSTLWHAGNSAQTQAGTTDGQYARWSHTAGRYEAFDLLGAANTWGGVQSFALPPTLLAVGGSEGGEIMFQRPSTGTTFNSNVHLDVWGDTVRVFAFWGAEPGARLAILDFAGMVQGNQTIWHSTNHSHAHIIGGTADGQYARWNHTAGRYEAFDLLGAANTWTNTQFVTSDFQARAELVGPTSGLNSGALLVGYLGAAKTVAPFAIGNHSSILGGAFNSRGVIFSNTESLDFHTSVTRIMGGVFESNTYARFVTNDPANSTIANVEASGALEAKARGTGAAFMTFHRPGAWAVHFGLDTDNQLKVGGQSFGAVSHVMWHAGNSAQTQAGTATGRVATWNHVAGRWEQGADAEDSRGNLRHIPTVSVGSSITINATTHAGCRLRKSGSTALTITADPGLPVGFSCVIRNANAVGAITIARGSGVELRIAGLATNANATLAPWGEVLLSVEDTNIIIISGAGAT